ncbi:hypothetical protein SAMN05421545_2879 [Pontibacter lucknowensis]|uniref:Lipoprotein n=2 Tax=Hymenobacteraceae TaxID=1853232 RepID=A0A1N6ZBF8_9BACT|nr:hypothetical protein SAMN05421545_2879 [Pontibacter lucknowensis]
MEHRPLYRTSLFSCLLAVNVLISCQSSKSTVSTNQVRKGEQLQHVTELTVEQFFQVWIANQYPVKLDINCKELYKDDAYTYFGKNYVTITSIKPRMFKVHNDSLALRFRKYQQVDGQLIRIEFWRKALAPAVADASPNTPCHYSSTSSGFKYQLHGDSIIITSNLKYKCNGKTLLQKSFKGYYDLSTMTMTLE